ncbi:MAG: SDR family NAD(P)-dependent oxidoreductase [Ktedonobacterales bacterium]
MSDPSAVEGLEVGLLANVAGLSHVGHFLDIPLEGMQRAVAINCRASLTLAHHFLPGMVARGRGSVIFFSSASAYQGTPLVTNYAATKAYNLVLGEGLWSELRGTGVDVLAFAPGATDTPGFRAATPQPARVAGMSMMEPAPTVAEALAALGKTPSHIAGRPNRLTAWLTSRLMSRRRAIETFGASMARLYPHLAV